MDKLNGFIDTYIYHNEENGYSVIKLEDGSTAVGILPELNSGESIDLFGEWVTHPKFGKQFKIDEFKVGYPTTTAGIIKFLSSRLIKGIGEKTAKKIVKKFGERTFEILDNEVERLSEIDGFGKKKIASIKQSWEEQKGIKDVMMFLQSYGVSTAHAIKIFKVYGNDSIKIVKQNPYRLTYDIWGIGFKTADEIAKSIGFSSDHPYRIKAGVLYILNEATRNGHVYLPFTELLNSVNQNLNYELEYSDLILRELESDGMIVTNKDKIYLASLYYAERRIENRIDLLLSQPPLENTKIDILLSHLKKYFTEEQVEAIRASIVNKLMILTGGPGTGKTETLRGIIKLYEQLEKKILLAAPTGRAAKRMTEVIGREAKTIHRLLEYNPSGDLFNYNNENPLIADLLVIDEVSMIDTLLMEHLLDAVSSETSIVLVGDIDQLPSVGPGNVLKDLIACDRIPVFRLTKIFRQAQESKIVLAAHNINKGIIPNLNIEKEGDLFFIEMSDPNKIPQLILELCSERLPATYNFNPMTDIQVLTPMHKSETGVSNLNELLQAGLNNNKVIYKKGKTIYKLGDKVMQLKNNYDREVFNGDLGFVQSYNDDENKMKINFNGKSIVFDSNELEEITLAYAVTVHKSQGSEYPCVIVPLTTSHYVMLQRNLLYTAITRASKLMIIIGTKQALSIAINNNKVNKRNTTLLKYSNDIIYE